MKRRQFVVVLILLGLVAFAAGVAHAEAAIDTKQSVIMIHVFKSGMFSTFADNHEVQAPVAEGTVDETKREVQFVVKSSQLKVLDPNLAPEKRGEVQARMVGPDVLDVEKFPEIRFQSTEVQPSGPNRFRVRGELSLHGQKQPVALEVQGKDGSYTGQCSLKQHDYGIKPISIAGGTVKVKDELKIEFTIVMGGARP